MTEREAMARLVERLLVDRELRGRFRRDPVQACREAGLESLVPEMVAAESKAAHTVDLRESKSSLAGVLIAAAAEGLVIAEFLETYGAVADAAGKVALPDVGGVRLDLPGVDLPEATLRGLALPGTAVARVPGAVAAGAHAEPAAGAAAPEAHEPAAEAAAPEAAKTPAAEAAKTPAAEAAKTPAADADPPAAPAPPEPADPSAVRAAAPPSVIDPAGGDGPQTLAFRAGQRARTGAAAPDPEASIQFPVAGEPSGGAEVAERLVEATPAAPTDYPGDDATPEEFAAWMAAGARERDLPPELPVMAALVESGLENLSGGDRDSVGFFQMRVGIWNDGEYEGYPKRPELQLKWFLDQAADQRALRVSRGQSVSDPSQYGEWIADVERPAAQYRGRYQFRLDQARELLERARVAPPPDSAPAATDIGEPRAARASLTEAPHAAADGHHDVASTARAAGRAALDNPRLHFDADGIADLKAGRIDPRVVAVLSRLAEHHDLRVSCMRSDHAKFSAGGSISNHWYGRGVDIAAVDGRPVGPGNNAARRAAERIAEMNAAYRPTEIGAPWKLDGPEFFSDGAHQDHLHIAFDDPLPDGWRAPAELLPGADAPQALRAVAPTGSAADPDGTLSFGSRAERASSDGVDDASLQFPAAKASEVPARGAETARPPGANIDDPDRAARLGLDEVADAGRAPAAGARALAAVAEAKKYLGTAYQWGGETPRTGFDCSGLMQWAYAKQGIQVTRTTYTQIEAAGGTKVARHDLRPGDLVFFASPGGDVHHVGMSLGGDRFLHAPHTGDVVKISKLTEPYYQREYAGARRFDHEAPVEPRAQREYTPDPEQVQLAERAHAEDAAAARDPESLVFQALSRQEASHHASTLQFLVKSDRAAAQRLTDSARDAGLDLGDQPVGPDDYPGDGAGKRALAQWLGEQARQRGLPPELPVMAALVESNVRNLSYGHADSVGFFQMRLQYWNTGKYAGYPDRPELQMQWFIDHALDVKRARLADGDRAFLNDPAQWGEWVADVEKCAEQYRGRYQERLAEARALLRG